MRGTLQSLAAKICQPFLLLILSSILVGCGEQAIVINRDQTKPVTAAEAEGSWLNVNDDGSGFHLGPDGRFIVFGKPEITGTSWKLVGGKLALSFTSTEAEGPQEETYFPGYRDGRLALAGPYTFTGDFGMQESQAITGTLTSAQTVTLPKTVSAEIELWRQLPEEADMIFVARQSIPNAGNLPISFSVPVISSLLTTNDASQIRARVVEGTQEWFTGSEKLTPNDLTAGTLSIGLRRTGAAPATAVE